MTGSTELKSVGSLKKGSSVVIDGVACRVTNLAISRPGKHGHAKVRLEAVGIIDGKKKQIVMPGHDNIEVPIIDKRTAQVLSITEDHANVMDMETYETFDIKISEDVEGGPVTAGCEVLYWVILDDKVLKQVKSKG